MQIINTPNLNYVYKEIQKLKKSREEIVVQAQDEEFNRKILENPDVDMVVGFEMHNRRDRLKQRDSGLNEVLCKLAKKNNIKIGIDLREISKLDKIDKGKILARIMQNIRLCKRVGTQIIVLGNYKRQEIMSFFLSLKGSTEQGKMVFKEL